MNLIIDIGNTRIKLAVFNQQQQLANLLVTSSQKIRADLSKLLHQYPVQAAIISQVGNAVPDLEDFFKNHQIKYFYVSAALKLPFKIAYKTPETIGADRLGLVAGALLRQPNKNQLIIDAGTCVTYDFVDEKNMYHGGAISPGLQLRYKSLHDYTANLPLLSTPKHTIDLIGKDTLSAIHSGVIWGLVNEIEGVIVKYNLNFYDLTVYLTGGDEKLLDRYIKNKIFVSSKFLLLEGMNHILNLNK